MIKVIKTREDYEAAMDELSRLIAASPAPSSPEADRIEILGVLIEDYETKHANPIVIDPIEAIKFRMDQAGLKARDLIPYIGSRSKVSEVLAGKRTLTLSMIRALNTGLGIPAESLIQVAPESTDKSELEVDWERFPVKEIVRRGWTSRKKGSRSTPNNEILMRDFFAPLGGPTAASALYRQSDHVRAARSMDRYALAAWTARVMMRALELENPNRFAVGSLVGDVIREIVQLSRFEDGPLRARDALHTLGIELIVEPHLPKTHIDGAALMLADGRPVVALTLRYDRIDNFWFTLLHELAHVDQHVVPSYIRDRESVINYYDDLDVDADADPREREADDFAGESLVPSEAWEASAARFIQSPEAVTALAEQLGINVAIVAGKARHFFKNYRLLNSLVGHGSVRHLFSEAVWPS